MKRKLGARLFLGLGLRSNHPPRLQIARYAPFEVVGMESCVLGACASPAAS